MSVIKICMWQVNLALSIEFCGLPGYFRIMSIQFMLCFLYYQNMKDYDICSLQYTNTYCV